MPTPRSTKKAPTPAAARQPKIIVKNSRVHGRGVYAGRKLAKGERVIEYKGELISWKECDRRPPSDPDDPFHTFFFSLSDGKHVLDASVGGNDARWINHSCNPNCETEEDDEARRVFVVTTRDVNAGEELNYDYGKAYFTEYLKDICACPKCEEKRAAAKAGKKPTATKVAKNKAKAAKKKKAAKTKSASAAKR